MKIKLLALAAASMIAAHAGATTIGFENFASAGNLVNVNPSAPYVEAGYRFTPSNSESAVFDSAAGADFPPDATDFFGFAGGNVITVNRVDGLSFDLTSLLAGKSTIGGVPISITLTGFNGATQVSSATFSGLTTATTISPLFTDVTRVTMVSTSDAGIDDVVVGDVPEPAMIGLFGLGALGLGLSRRRRA